MRRFFCFRGKEASRSSLRLRVDDGADHACRGRPPVDSQGIKTTGGSHKEAIGSTPSAAVTRSSGDQPLSDGQRRENTGGCLEPPPEDHRSEASGSIKHDSDGSLKDETLLKNEEEGAHGRRRGTTDDCREEEDTLYHGQSSNDHPEVVSEVYCRICREKKYSFEFMTVKGCGHTFCACCVSQYASSRVEANHVRVLCPDTQCKDGFLEPEMCRFILPPAVLDLWGAKLCEEAIQAGEKFYCPYRECSALLVVEEEDEGKVNGMSECPHCSKPICWRCRTRWHAGINCDKYQKLWAGKLAKEDRKVMKLAKKKNWQRCPKCSFLVEKIEGCNLMRCRCHHIFCYKCAELVTGRGHSCPVSEV